MNGTLDILIQGGAYAYRDTWINCLGSYHVRNAFCDGAGILDYMYNVE
jgi:hypothetical protein